MAEKGALMGKRALAAVILLVLTVAMIGALSQSAAAECEIQGVGDEDGHGLDTCARTQSDCDTVTISGNCQVKICAKGWKDGGTNIKYGNFRTGTNCRAVDMDDQKGPDCDDDIKASYSWSVSGESLTITTKAARHEAAPVVDAGYTLEAINCKFSDGSTTKEEKVLADLPGDIQTAQRTYQLAGLCKDNDGDKYDTCPPKACGTGDYNTAGQNPSCGGKTQIPECDLVDVGSCKVKVCPKGWDEEDNSCCQYGNYQTGNGYRQVEIDDASSGGDCDDDVIMKNSWTVSGSTITVNSEARKTDAGHRLGAGFVIEAVNCQFSDNSVKKEEKLFSDLGDTRTAQRSYTVANCPATAPADCDDANPIINPGSNNPYCNCNDADGKKPVAETCDGVDNDCDTLVDEGYDRDGDGYTPCSGTIDCDDNDPTVYPGAPEKCDRIDQNCNGNPYDGVEPDDCEELCTGSVWTGEEERIVHTWVRDKCCGDDADEYLKYSTEPCGTGCCGSSECYDASTKSCVASGKLSGDKYCNGGEWSDRSNAILAILEDQANQMGASRISVLCGTYEEALNSYDYPILGKLAADYFREPCIITNRNEPCAGELCVAELDGKVFVAGSLNFEPKPSEIKELLSHDKECKAALATDRTTILPCNRAPDKLWYSKRTGIFVYSSEEFKLPLNPDTGDFELYLDAAKYSHELDSKLYLEDKSGKENGPMVSGALYQSSCEDDGGTSENLEIYYSQFGNNMCRATSHLGEGASCDDYWFGSYNLFATRKAGEYNSYFEAWLDLTAKLRLTKACPAGCVCDEFNDIIECPAGERCGDFSTNPDCYCNDGETKECFSCPRGSVCAVADNCRCSTAATCTTDKDCMQPLCPVSDEGVSSCPTIKCVSGQCASV